MNEKQKIFQSLKQQILLLEGFKETVLTEQTSLGRINEAFPNGVFPFSALHEFFCFNKEQAAASSAFIAGLLSSRLCKRPPAPRWWNLGRYFPPYFQSLF